MEQKKKSNKFSASFKAGAAALIFLILGYQSSLFISMVGIKRQSSSDSTVTVVVDTVYVSSDKGEVVGRRVHSDPTRLNTSKNKLNHDNRKHPVNKFRPTAESFPFNPNTISVEDLERLGFSMKQARSIEAYRLHGGRFHRASDFAKSYVVSDTLFERLEPYIYIPKLDINSADSSDFDALPGIGPYFASKMVQYRQRLGGYSYSEQLMDIWHFDREKYLELEDLIETGPVRGYALWSLPEDSLKLHPYIGQYAAHGIVVFRENSPREKWTVDNLEESGIISHENASKLKRCKIE